MIGLKFEILHNEKDDESDRNVKPMRFTFLGIIFCFGSILATWAPGAIGGFAVFALSFIFYKPRSRNQGTLQVSDNSLVVEYKDTQKILHYSQIHEVCLYYGGYDGFIRVFPRKVEGGERNFIYIRDTNDNKSLYRIVIKSLQEYQALMQVKSKANYLFSEKEMPEYDSQLWTLLS